METPCGERRTIDLTESPAHPGEDIRVYDLEIWRQYSINVKVWQ